MISTKPDIRLLGNGGIEIPPYIVSEKLRICMRVAILLAEQVGLGMFTCEMENVNRKTNIFEDWVVLDHFSKCAIVVKEYVVWHEVNDPIGSNDHLLVILVNEQCGNSQEVA